MTADLPAQASVVVIGGGVIGLSTAYHLAAAGVRDVLLLERDTFGSGSTSQGRRRGACAVLRRDEHRARPAEPAGLRAVRGDLRAGDRPAPGRLPLPARRPRARRGVHRERRAAERAGRAEPDDRAGRGEAAVPAGRPRGRPRGRRGRPTTATAPRSPWCSGTPGRRAGPERGSSRTARSRASRSSTAEVQSVLTDAGRVQTETVVCAAGRVVARGRGDGRGRPPGRAAAPAGPHHRAGARRGSGHPVHDRLLDQPVLPPRGPRFPPRACPTPTRRRASSSAAPTSGCRA